MSVLATTRRRLRRLFGLHRVSLAGTGLVSSVPDRHARGQTRTQQLFIDWNAERLGLSREESARRYAASWAVLPGGHSGRRFRAFNGLAHDVFRVLYDDAPGAVFETYRYHAPMHMLVMLTYPEPALADSDLIVRELIVRPRVSLLDVGCGLAQQSRTLAEYLSARGVAVELTFIDIPTVRQEFLTWWGARTGIPTRFLPCTREQPIPALPPADLCFATEFFEHVHEPVRYFEAIDAVLAPGSLLITAVMDHHHDFMHVSPSLAPLRARIAERGYATVFAERILRKPATP